MPTIRHYYHDYFEYFEGDCSAVGGDCSAAAVKDYCSCCSVRSCRFFSRGQTEIAASRRRSFACRSTNWRSCLRRATTVWTLTCRRFFPAALTIRTVQNATIERSSCLKINDSDTYWPVPCSLNFEREKEEGLALELWVNLALAHLGFENSGPNAMVTTKAGVA